MSLILPSRTHHVLFYILEKTPLSLSLSFFLFPFFGPRGLTLDFTWTRCLETPDAKDGGRSGRVRQQQCHAVQKLLQGAAEAIRVRSMQDRHLLFQGLPGAHSTQKTGRPCNKGCHRLVKRTHKSYKHECHRLPHLVRITSKRSTRGDFGVPQTKLSLVYLSSILTKFKND